MSKFKFINIVDIIFISLITFLIVLAWIQFFVKNLMISIIISALLSISILILLRWMKFKKHLAQQHKLVSSTQLVTFKLAIQTMPQSKLNLIIKKLLPSKYNPKIYKGDIIFNKNNSLN
ncbi:MAG: hypothetical protein ACLRFE_01340, partial [Clostridia bacterium]